MARGTPKTCRQSENRGIASRGPEADLRPDPEGGIWDSDLKFQRASNLRSAHYSPMKVDIAMIGSGTLPSALVAWAITKSGSGLRWGPARDMALRQ